MRRGNLGRAFVVIFAAARREIVVNALQLKKFPGFMKKQDGKAAVPLRALHRAVRVMYQETLIVVDVAGTDGAVTAAASVVTVVAEMVVVAVAAVIVVVGETVAVAVIVAAVNHYFSSIIYIPSNHVAIILNRLTSMEADQ
jgi:hypothetical protein